MRKRWNEYLKGLWRGSSGCGCSSGNTTSTLFFVITMLPSSVPDKMTFLCRRIATTRLSAYMGLFPCVRAHVIPERGTYCSRIPATRHVTGVGPLPCMSAHVGLQSGGLCSRVTTARHSTGVGSFPSVTPHVSIKVVFFRSFIAATGFPTFMIRHISYSVSLFYPHYLNTNSYAPTDGVDNPNTNAGNDKSAARTCE